MKFAKGDMKLKLYVLRIRYDGSFAFLLIMTKTIGKLRKCLAYNNMVNKTNY